MSSGMNSTYDSYKSVLMSFCRMQHLQMVFIDCYMPKESSGKEEIYGKVKKLVMFDEIFNLSYRSKPIDSSFIFIYGVHLVIPPDEACSMTRRVQIAIGKTEEEACKKFIDTMTKAEFFHVYRPGKSNVDTSLEGITSLETLKIIVDLNSNAT